MLPYEHSMILTIVYIVLCVGTLGGVLLITKWFPQWRVYLTHWRSTFEKCTTVVIKCTNNKAIEVCKVIEENTYYQSSDSQQQEVLTLRMMYFRRKCYIYNSRMNVFVPRVLYVFVIYYLYFILTCMLLDLIKI
jgi:hypothetical protein